MSLSTDVMPAPMPQIHRPWKSLANKRNKMDGLELLCLIPPQSARVAFFDPQYRGVLDKLAYGNEGQSRGKARSGLPQMGADLIARFICGIWLALKPSGYLFLWVDKFHFVEGVSPWFSACPGVFIVDMLTWDKQKVGMGYRTRRRCEHLVIVQKAPKVAKGTWKIHNIPDVWQEKLLHRQHIHAKPPELQKQLILATTEKDDYVLDPAAGSYSVLTACTGTGRNFIGCDLIYGEEQGPQPL